MLRPSRVPDPAWRFSPATLDALREAVLACADGAPPARARQAARLACDEAKAAMVPPAALLGALREALGTSASAPDPSTPEHRAAKLLVALCIEVYYGR